MRSWCSPRSISMADGCVNVTERCEVTCSPSSNIPMCRPTTMAASGNCVLLPPTARSLAASDRAGAPTCSPISGPSSEPPHDAEPMHIRQFSQFCAGDQCSKRVEQIQFADIAAYLRERDISNFDPKAPPAKTAAFWSIVDANRPAEESELADIIDKLKNPNVLTLLILQNGTSDSSLADWLADRKNRRVIPYRLEQCLCSR